MVLNPPVFLLISLQNMFFGRQKLSFFWGHGNMHEGDHGLKIGDLMCSGK